MNTHPTSRGKLNQNPLIGAQMMEKTSATVGARECWTVVENDAEMLKVRGEWSGAEQFIPRALWAMWARFSGVT